MKNITITITLPNVSDEVAEKIVANGDHSAWINHETLRRMTTTLARSIIETLQREKPNNIGMGPIFDICAMWMSQLGMVVTTPGSTITTTSCDSTPTTRNFNIVIE